MEVVVVDEESGRTETAFSDSAPVPYTEGLAGVAITSKPPAAEGIRELFPPLTDVTPWHREG